jgi:hypothetical protein
MRRFALIVVLILVCWLCVGILVSEAKEVSPQERCAMWVSIMCEKLVETHEVTYVGNHDGKEWCYTPYTRQCYWTGEDSNVWSFPAVDTGR